MLINEKTWDFVRKHADSDVRKLALQGTKDEDVDLPMALQQIVGRQTARHKLPSWAAVEGVVYPPHLNMEHCSSEQTARYKAQIVNSKSSNSQSFVDLTGGLGVDFYWMSQGFDHRTYVEQNVDLCALVEENFRTLDHSCNVCCSHAATYLDEMPHADVIFLDPARRNEHGGRTYGIEDCTPNVLELLPLLMQKATKVILKLSPMLDWHKAVSDLKSVNEVHIVSVDNECKELLLVLEEVHSPTCGRSVALQSDLRVVCVNFSKDGEQLFETSYGGQFSPSHPLTFSPSHFLYEPNASIMKAGCFDALAAKFPVWPVSANSHLFLSSDEIVDFPGRRFQILAISSANGKALKVAAGSLERANIAVRNFPMTAEQLRKKLKLKDGGDTYIFATTTADKQHQLFICRKIG